MTPLEANTLINPVMAIRQVSHTTYLKTDTLFPDCCCLLKAEVDNIVFVPATNSHFYIIGTTGGVENSPYFSETPCLSGRMNFNIHVNDHMVTAFMAVDQSTCLDLKK